MLINHQGEPCFSTECPSGDDPGRQDGYALPEAVAGSHDSPGARRWWRTLLCQVSLTVEADIRLTKLKSLSAVSAELQKTKGGGGRQERL